MTKKYDKLLILASYLYLILPIIIFLFGFLKFYIAIGSTVILAYSLIRILKSWDYIEVDTKIIKKFIFPIIAIIIWVVLSGIGGLVFQNLDHNARNAILRDLINYKWPVIYNYENVPNMKAIFGDTGTMVYYFTYWLPSALVGKVFGWKIANFALLIWSIGGVFLGFCLITRYIKKVNNWMVIILILWSGMDALGLMLLGNSLFPFGIHIEWWAGLFQYSSNTTQLFWVFNQVIPVWVIIGLMLNQRKNKSFIFTASLCLPLAPFSFIGLVPFIIFANRTNDEKVNFQWIKNLVLKITNYIKSYVSFQNIAGSGVVVVIFSAFFIMTNSLKNNSGLIFNAKENVTQMVLIYILFCIIEFGAYAAIVARKHYRNRWFIIAIISLFLIPLYKSGDSNEFPMRVSISALFILMIFVIDFLYNLKSVNKHIMILKIILCIFLMIGSITAGEELWRTYYETINNNLHSTDNWKTLSTDANFDSSEVSVKNFIVGDYKNTIFFKYFAK